MKKHYLPVSWPEQWQNKLNHVHAVTTLKSGGVSSGCFSSFNLATHVGDDLPLVLNNREKLRADLQLPSEPVWLEQVHSDKVILLDGKSINTEIVPQADASFTRSKGVVCAVLTADCLPVFICNKQGSEVAVVHAGWRGLHAGIISNTIKAMHSPAGDLLVHLGPAIGPQAFEVGSDVFQAFTGSNRLNEFAFAAMPDSHYLCDIYQLARTELQSLDIRQITGGENCTFRDKQQFYSFRRQQNTGRMASLIWFE